MTAAQRSTRTLHVPSRENISASARQFATVGFARPAPRTVNADSVRVEYAQASSNGVVRHLERPARAASAVAPVTLPSGQTGVSSEALLKGEKVVQITHNGEIYQLRATRHGKLILTK